MAMRRREGKGEGEAGSDQSIILIPSESAQRKGEWVSCSCAFGRPSDSLVLMTRGRALDFLRRCQIPSLVPDDEPHSCSPSIFAPSSRTLHPPACCILHLALHTFSASSYGKKSWSAYARLCAKMNGFRFMHMDLFQKIVLSLSLLFSNAHSLLDLSLFVFQHIRWSIERLGRKTSSSTSQ